MKKTLTIGLFVLALGVAAVTVPQLPDIKRYLNISSM